jgi:hypothetical protein
VSCGRSISTGVLEALLPRISSVLPFLGGAAPLVVAETFSPHLAYVENFKRDMREAGWSYLAGPVSQQEGRAQDGGVYIFSKHPIKRSAEFVYGSCDVDAGLRNLGLCGLGMGSDCGSLNPFRCTECNNDEDCLASKGLLYARVEKPVGGGRVMGFNIATTHLQSGNTTTPGIAAMRKRQLQRIREIVDRELPGISKSEPFILAGDLNIDAAFPGSANECSGMLQTLRATGPRKLPLRLDGTSRPLYFTSGDNSDLRCATTGNGALACRSGECTIAVDAKKVASCNGAAVPYEWLDYVATLGDFLQPFDDQTVQPLEFRGAAGGIPVMVPWNFRDIGYNIANGWSLTIGDRKAVADAATRPVWNLSDHHPLLAKFRFPLP